MKKNRIVTTLVVMAAIGAGNPTATSVSLFAADDDSAAARPNILLIITDQQQAGMMSCAGNPWVRTPNMDRLAAQGMRFERAYAANPVCIPSRFSMFSGLMPSAIKMEDNKDVENTVDGNIQAHAMGSVFRGAGYRTVYAGKVHLPGEDGVRDNVAAYGFDERLASKDHEGRDSTVDACKQFINRPQEKPFLLVASLINPHDICYLPLRDFNKAEAASGKKPQQLPPPALVELNEALQLPQGLSGREFFETQCPPLPSNHAIDERELSAPIHTHGYLGFARSHYNDTQWRMYRWAYARLTERVDGQVGQLLDALKNAGLEEKTLILFVSDHGDQCGAHHAATKGLLYEESIRVPFIVTWKGVTRSGQVDNEHLVSSGLDLIPTLCDFAGIRLPAALKGHSVRALAEGRTVTEWRKYLVVENNSARLVRYGNWKYQVGCPPKQADLKNTSGKEWVREALYDLSTDPGEMHNLAFDPSRQDCLKEGRRLLTAWYRDHGLNLDPAYIVTEAK